MINNNWCRPLLAKLAMVFAIPFVIMFFGELTNIIEFLFFGREPLPGKSSGIPIRILLVLVAGAIAYFMGTWGWNNRSLKAASLESEKVTQFDSDGKQINQKESRPTSVTTLSWFLIIPGMMFLVVLIIPLFTHISKGDGKGLFVTAVAIAISVFGIYCGSRLLKGDKLARKIFFIGYGLLLAVLFGITVMDASNNRSFSFIPFITGSIWFAVYYIYLNTDEALQYFEVKRD